MDLRLVHQFNPDETIVGICHYHGALFVATTRRIYQLEHPEDPNNLRVRILSAIPLDYISL